MPNHLTLTVSAVIALAAAFLVDHAGMAAFGADVAHHVDVYLRRSNLIHFVFIVLMVAAVAVGQGGQRRVAIPVLVSGRFQVFTDHQGDPIRQGADPVGSEPAAAAAADPAQLAVDLEQALAW